MSAHATDPRENSVQDLNAPKVAAQPAAPQNAGGNELSGKQEHCMPSFSCLQTSPANLAQISSGNSFLNK